MNKKKLAKIKAIDELYEFRGLGEMFNYLGCEIIVTGHSVVRPSGFGVCTVPELSGDYVDKCGVIRSITFDYSELAGLKEQNTKV